MKHAKKISIKLLVFLLTLLLSATAFGFNNRAGANPKADVYSTYSTLKVTQEQENFEKFSAHIEVYAAKGETESAQIIITPKTNIKSVTVSLSDLIKDNGQKFDKENVNVFWQKYIEIEQKTTKNENNYYPIGMYPDMLLPIDKAVSFGENNVLKGKNQGLTFDFVISENVEAGVYTGSFKIITDGVENVVPVTLTVWDYELGRANGYTVFQIWQNTMMYGEFNNTDESYRKYFETLLNEYKTCPQYLPNAELGAQAFVESVKKYWDNKYLTTINIPTFGENTNHSLVQPEFKSYIKELALECTPDAVYFDRAVCYLTIVDEPYGEAAELAVKNITYKIKDICEEVYEELTASGFFNDFGGNTGDFAYRLKESIEGLQIVVTSQTIEGYGDGIDTCCPYISVYETEYDGDVLRNHGNGNWAYTCIEPVYPYPSHHIDDYLIGGRILRWIQKANDIEGYLYWGVSEYYNQGLGVMLNPYEDSYRWSDGITRVNGDGYLFYPGFKYGSDTPFGSLRAVTLRDGQEDYDTLCLLEDILTQLSDYYSDENIYLDNVISDLYDKILQRTVYNSDDQTFDLVRKELANIVLRAKNQKIVSTDLKMIGNGYAYSVFAPADSELTVDGKVVNGIVSGQGKRYDITVTDGRDVSSLNVKIDGVSYNFNKQLKGELSTAVNFSNIKDRDISMTKNSTYNVADGKFNVCLVGFEKGKDPTLIERSLTIEMSKLPISFNQIENLYITVTNVSQEDTIMTITTDNDIGLEKVLIKAGETKEICIKKVYDIKDEYLEYAYGLNFYFANAYYVEKYVEDGVEKNYRFYSDIELSFSNIYYTEKAGA